MSGDAKAKKKNGAEPGFLEGLRKSDAWTDLALTLPIFVAYHLGVVFLPIRNAADPVTTELRVLANQSLLLYAGMTLAVGAVFVAVLMFVGDRKAFDKKRFLLIAVEGALYAALMRFAGSYVVGHLRLGGAGDLGPFASVVMALGAGFYEEIAFRVVLYGGGAWVLAKLFTKGANAIIVQLAWAGLAAAVFSGWHYFGSLGDAFEIRSFVFRAVCGLTLVTIYRFRGFAPAVWTHAIYDLWVMLG